MGPDEAEEGKMREEIWIRSQNVFSAFARCGAQHSTAQHSAARGILQRPEGASLHFGPSHLSPCQGGVDQIKTEHVQFPARAATVAVACILNAEERG